MMVSEIASQSTQMTALESWIISRLYTPRTSGVKSMTLLLASVNMFFSSVKISSVFSKHPQTAPLSEKAVTFERNGDPAGPVKLRLRSHYHTANRHTGWGRVGVPAARKADECKDLVIDPQLVGQPHVKTAGAQVFNDHIHFKGFAGGVNAAHLGGKGGIYPGLRPARHRRCHSHVSSPRIKAQF